MDFPTERQATWIAAGIVVLAIVVLWCLPLTSSFWIDETGTIWALRPTVPETLAQLSRAPGQPSSLFFVVTWIAVRTGAALGASLEVAVRLPSIIASLIAAAGIYRLARRFADRLASIVAVGTFATYFTMSFAAADARPYALAMAAVVWAMFLLFRWCDTGNLAYGVGYAVLVAAGIELHYTTALLIPVQLYHLAYGERSARVTRMQVGVVAGTLGILLLPFAAHVMSLWGERTAHSFASTPGARDLIDALVDVRVIAAFIVLALAARVLNPQFSWTPSVVVDRPYRLLLIWLVLPKVLLYLVSVSTDAKIFVARYYIWCGPALALLAAAILSTMVPQRARRMVAVVLLLVLSLRPVGIGAAAHGGQDWRGALAQAEQVMSHGTSALMMQVGFIEARTGPSTTPSTADDPLVAPLAAYPVRGDVFLMPSAIDSGTTDAFARLATERLLGRDRILLLSPVGLESTELWWDGRLGAAGYTVESRTTYPGLTLVVWRRPGS